MGDKKDTNVINIFTKENTNGNILTDEEIKDIYDHLDSIKKMVANNELSNLTMFIAKNNGELNRFTLNASISPSYEERLFGFISMSITERWFEMFRKADK